jgi:hypothetical protein
VKGRIWKKPGTAVYETGRNNNRRLLERLKETTIKSVKTARLRADNATLLLHLPQFT